MSAEWSHRPVFAALKPRVDSADQIIIDGVGLIDAVSNRETIQ